MYGRGENSIAEQLGCTVEEARNIKNNVYDEFPGIKKFERESARMVKEMGFVTTLWGRKRRLPNYNLPNYTFEYVDENGNVKPNMEVPNAIKAKHTSKLDNMFWKKKNDYIKEVLDKEQIKITDNGGKIADASRQIINSRVQGCLDGNTTIKTLELGDVKIADVVNRSDLHVWDGEIWSNCDILASGKKQKCIITLENGQTITCSPDHKFRVILPDGSKIWKKCSELTENDNIDEDDTYATNL